MSVEMYEDAIYGQILPMEWDGDTIASLMILVDGEEEILVEADKNSAELFRHIDRWVTAEGLICEGEDGVSIRISDFTLEDSLDFSDDDTW